MTSPGPLAPDSSASIVRWLRGAGYDDAANALAELHVEDCALRGIEPSYYVEPSQPGATRQAQGQEKRLGRISAVLVEARDLLHSECFATGEILVALKDVADLRAALHAQPEADGWQPIETAPKDADLLLLYLDGSGVQSGYWDDDRWLACETRGLTGGGWHTEPTHWMPLPASPRALASPQAKTT